MAADLPNRASPTLTVLPLKGEAVLPEVVVMGVVTLAVPRYGANVVGAAGRALRAARRGRARLQTSGTPSANNLGICELMGCYSL